VYGGKCDVDLETIGAPKNVSALTTITQVIQVMLLLPKGEGVTQFEIFFGDATTKSVIVNPGGTFTQYREGI
jgi:hypothetical protein